MRRDWEMRALLNQAQDDCMRAITRWAERIYQEFGPGLDFHRAYLATEWPVVVQIYLKVYLRDVQVAQHIFQIRVRDGQ